MSVFDEPVVFVDVETTGMSAGAGRVIEIAAIRVENGRVAAKINSLVNPEGSINPYIQTITGIKPSQLENAPVFADVAEQLADTMHGAVFIAHNVRFDYSFIRAEFRRLGINFKPKMLCSVKLSRELYPQYRRHSLESIIERHRVKVNNRHRAYDDAKAVWEFLKIAEFENSVEALQAAIAKQLKSPALPSGIDRSLVANLPQSHGVYVFKDSNNQSLYVGKSVNIKKRVLSHFSSDHSSGKEMKIGQQIADITTYQTNGELESLLLEAQLVKELQPLHNRRLRHVKKLTLALLSQDQYGYSQVSLNEADSDSLNPLTLNKVLAVYPTRGRARQALEDYVKIYGLCPKSLGLENGPGPCFLYQLKKCQGACKQLETQVKHNFRVEAAFMTTRMRAWPYSGPVLLKEDDPEGDGTSGIVVDQWCVVAHLKENKDSDTLIKTVDKRFDLDTYKILQSFLARKQRSLSIRILTQNQLANLKAYAY